MRRRRPDWPQELIGGGLACLLGLGIILISFLDPRQDAFPHGRPVVLVAGLVFFLAGVAILVPVLGRGRDTTLLQSAIGATLLSGFAAIPALIVLGGSRGLPLFASIAVLAVLVPLVWDFVLRRLIPRRAARLWLYAGLALVLAFAVARRPFPKPAPAPPASVFDPVTLELQRDSVAAGAAVRMTFDPPLAMPYGHHYWISIVPRGVAVHAQGIWAYVDPGATAAELEAPDQPGEYEVRLHPHMNAVLASRPLLVRPAGTPVDRPDVELR